jgi:sugar/nucleoside kinase (ribokinase family)
VSGVNGEESILCVGSVALDSVETPFGSAERVIGGSAVYFTAAASLFHEVKVVGVVGADYPLPELAFLSERGADLSGIERRDGESFFWAGRYHYDLNSRDTLETKLGVFAHFEPKIPASFRAARYVFLGNIDPKLQHDVLDQVEDPEVVACDTMNYWIEKSRGALLDLLGRVRILIINDEEVRQLAGEPNLETGSSSCRASRSSRCSIRPERGTRSPAASWGTSRAPARSRPRICAARWSTAP